MFRRRVRFSPYRLVVLLEQIGGSLVSNSVKALAAVVHSLLPVNAKGIVTNFHQADTNQDGKVSQAEFLAACKLGLVTGNVVDINIVADEVY